MSTDQLAPSFGDPNAQQPSPTQTPTTTFFPSPVFETPRNNRTSLDEPGGWTPQFAEEYSVFNATPGNLRGSQGGFAEYTGPFTPAAPPSSTAAKRPLSAEGLAVEIAAHATHFSPNPNLPLPPVEPSRRLASSPGLRPDQVAEVTSGAGPVERSSKKARHITAAKKSQGQTATPPPSARKGERKLAPRSKISTMQHDQGFAQPEFMGTPQQQQQQQHQASMGMFVTTPTDMFGYPMSTPATAPAYADSRTFWETDASMTGMDIDFSSSNAQTFQTNAASHRAMGSIDWGRHNQMFQETGLVPQQNQNQENLSNLSQSTTGHNSLMASKGMMPNIDTSQAGQNMFDTTYPTPIDDPFGIVTPGGGVNPDLLYSRPPSSSMDAVSFNHSQAPSSSAPPARQSGSGDQSHLVSKAPMRADLRRSSSVREIAPAKKLPASSPIKPSARTGLSRSFSESRGKRPLARAPLPALAPAIKPMAQPASVFPPPRSASQSSSRSSGRISPLKQSHSRLSSLTSIPEQRASRAHRTSVKFTIDANGRARVETTVDTEDLSLAPLSASQHKTRPLHKQRWGSSEEDSSSSSDDEPIIIPSRNHSFALPDPHVVPDSRAALHASHHSLSERSSSSTRVHSDDVESEAETILNDATPSGTKGGAGEGDAASELEKLRQARSSRGGYGTVGGSSRKHGASSGHKPRFASAGHDAFRSVSFQGNTVSPPAASDGLPTPSSPWQQNVRCVCNRPDPAAVDGFLVQCESCDNWLHGRCINISKRTLPSVYICAFCADTPNMRGGRIRDNGRVSAAAMGPPGSAASPLAHKSFKSFR